MRRRGSRYAHVRSLDHAERILLKQARTVREQAGDDNSPASAALRGKAVAYQEAATLLAVLRRKWEAGELDETKRVDWSEVLDRAAAGNRDAYRRFM